MRISELYSSIQGEGEYAGVESVFVRTTGCNLRCWFCDTPFTSWAPEGDHISLDELVRRVISFQIEHVVLTGGEPLLPDDVSGLIERLTAAGHLITLETAGTIYRDVAVHLMSISPKLSNSTPQQHASVDWIARHEAQRNRPEVMQQLMSLGRYQLKFVIDQPDDVIEVEQYLAQLPTVDRARVWLMPQAITREQLVQKTDWLQPLAAEHHFRFSERRHIATFGNVRGK
mgnify:CR=1 FL=1